MELTPIERTSASGAVFEQLISELVAGNLEPGESLPAERALTERLSVNRQAVREALQRLAQAGLVKIRQGEPTRALDFRQSATLDLLARLLFRADGSLDVGVVRSIVEMRACIGPDVARMAAQRIQPEATARLAQVTSDMDASAGDLDRLVALDLEFWDILVDASDNIAYRLAYNSLKDTYQPTAAALSGVMAEELTDSTSHVRLLEAVTNSDAPGAATAARELLSKGSVAVTRMLGELRRGRDA